MKIRGLIEKLQKVVDENGTDILVDCRKVGGYIEPVEEVELSIFEHGEKKVFIE